MSGSIPPPEQVPSAKLNAAGDHAAPPIESDKEFFGKAGGVPTSWDEGRRFPRFYYRAYLQATIHPLRRTGGEPERCTILTRDLSRGGMSFLHVGQLFPGQRLDVVLNDGVERSLEVLWCRRLRERCYLGGSRFVKADGSAKDVEAIAPAPPPTEPPAADEPT
jgi:hypothetical protein